MQGRCNLRSTSSQQRQCSTAASISSVAPTLRDLQAALQFEAGKGYINAKGRRHADFEAFMQVRGVSCACP